jgi:hypothetical protein
MCAGWGRSTTLELAAGQAGRLTCSVCGRRRPDVRWIARPRGRRKAEPARQTLGGGDPALNDRLDDLWPTKEGQTK